MVVVAASESVLPLEQHVGTLFTAIICLRYRLRSFVRSFAHFFLSFDRFARLGFFFFNSCVWVLSFASMSYHGTSELLVSAPTRRRAAPS